MQASEEATGVGKVTLSQVQLKLVGGDLSVLQEFSADLTLQCTCVGKTCKVGFYRDGASEVMDFVVSDSTHLYRAGPCIVFIRVLQGSAIVTAASQSDASKLLACMESSLPCERKRSELSTFNLRTEDGSAKHYFHFYGYLSQQQNMLQDYVRTSTYQSAMLKNTADFEGKVVLDVGAGTGVLSFFALQAGARKVYSVEASNMAGYCQKLVDSNNFSDKMTVISGKVEEVNVPEQVDMIISEPMGYMLFNERMLESFLHGKKWLKPGGKMFPTKGILYVAPFCDEELYLEQFSKSNFWTHRSFHGIDVSCLRDAALEECFKQPIKDTFDVRILVAKPVGHTTDFLTTNESDLIEINIPLQYKMWSTGMVHGLAFWFDCVFSGSESSVWLSTAPFQPLTHWYQVRVLLPKPIFLRKDQELLGHVKLVANERQSYDITVKLNVPGSDIESESCYDLKNPNFRYTTTPLAVPGNVYTAPTDDFYQETQQQQQQQSQQEQSPSLVLQMQALQPNSHEGALPAPVNLAASQFVSKGFPQQRGLDFLGFDTSVRTVNMGSQQKMQQNPELGGQGGTNLGPTH